MQVLEFFGYPGSGKTTVADILVDTVSGGRRRVYSVREIYRVYPWPTGSAKVTHVLRAGPFAWWVAVRSLALDSPSPAYRVRRALQLPRFFYPLERIRRLDLHAVVVLDQWLAHTFGGALLAGTLSREGAQTILAWYLERYDVTFIFLDLDRATAAARVGARSAARRHDLEDGCKNFWDGLNEEEVFRAIENFDQGFMMLREALESVGAQVVTLDATEDPNQMSAVLIDLLHLNAKIPSPLAS